MKSFQILSIVLSSLLCVAPCAAMMEGSTVSSSEEKKASFPLKKRCRSIKKRSVQERTLTPVSSAGLSDAIKRDRLDKKKISSLPNRTVAIGEVKKEFGKKENGIP